MNVKRAKAIRICLLIVACIALFYGIKAANTEAHNTDDIRISVTNKYCYYNPNESPYTTGNYHVDLTYEFENNTMVTWNQLQITTYVYTADGIQVATINSTIDGLHLEPKEVEKKTVYLEDNQPDETFSIIYETENSDLKYEFEITGGNYNQ